MKDYLIEQNISNFITQTSLDYCLDSSIVRKYYDMFFDSNADLFYAMLEGELTTNGNN